ncbi:Ribonuclease P protein subunit p29 [Pseudocercospora fuligena]|uniref:Ribonuclease P protein subunit n=1 Tax=Pseudocercospora fuligena TaxID=685502 RepID=A0A8H6RJL6_9PEZI|nr:Ribonuclease P protein subunit p29 [Pseudocercospora fuligena]
MASQPPEHIAEELLERAHPENAETIFRERVKQRPLLLRPSSPDPTLNARAKRQHERLQKEQRKRKSNKPKPLSAKAKRASCIYEIPKSQQKYTIYEPLHAMWCEYMRDILGLKNGRAYVDPTGGGPILASADYHGALIEVVRSRCVSRVGLQGIVVKDTKFTFEVITKRNDLKTVPKENTIFRFDLPQKGDDATEKKPLVFEIHGDQFKSRAPDRAAKKFKLHINSDL